jgi:hypothetical protein
MGRVLLSHHFLVTLCERRRLTCGRLTTTVIVPLQNRDEIAIMKTIYILVFILLTNIAFAQQIASFELTKNGVSPIVVNVDSLSASELYKRTHHWIEDYYKDQRNVLKTDVQDQKIKIDGLKKNAWFYTSADVTIQYDVEYSCYIDFEDNRLTLAFEFGKTWLHNDSKASNSYSIDYRKIWKESGEVHKIYKEAKPGMEQMMNELSHSLLNYLKDYSDTDNNSKSEKGRPVHKSKS